MTDWHYVIMPIAGAEAYTDQAIADVLAQTVPTRLLLINQALPTPFRTHLEQLAEQQPDRILLWSHVPPLPSLSATWNRALQFCWETGAEEALVVNNDVRLHQDMIRVLSTVRFYENALFVSAVGVRPEQFDPTVEYSEKDYTPIMSAGKGGPDFSCFLIGKKGHDKYPFDENFIPAFCEDLSTHREYMLGGDGGRIFSVNIPYLHYASQTLKTMDPVEREKVNQRIQSGSRAHYERAWGGPVNHERYAVKFDPESAQEGVTTPELQRKVLEGLGCTTA